MSLSNNFTIALKQRFRSKIFLAALIFIIAYFIFQILYRDLADYLSTFYIDMIPHASFGFVVGSFAYIFAFNYFRKKSDGLILAIIILALVGIAKELLDIFYFHKYFSATDFIANYIGFLIFYLAKK